MLTLPDDYHDIQDSSQDEYTEIVKKMSRGIPILSSALTRPGGESLLRHRLQDLLNDGLLTQKTPRGGTRISPYAKIRAAAALAAVLWRTQLDTAPRAEELTQSECRSIAATVSQQVKLDATRPGEGALRNLAKSIPPL